jgi:hypothetical protein
MEFNSWGRREDGGIPMWLVFWFCLFALAQMIGCIKMVENMVSVPIITVELKKVNLKKLIHAPAAIPGNGGGGNAPCCCC